MIFTKKYRYNSAYQSGLLVQEYKRRGGTYEGKKNSKMGLERWFLEKWKNREGLVLHIKVIYIDQL
jgi:hypothetical protein